MAKRKSTDDHEDERDEDYQDSDHDHEPSDDKAQGESADVSQEENDKSNATNKAKGGRVRIVGRTKYCGVVSARIKEPVKAERTQGDYFCPICGSPFTRAEGVNYHFPGCVRKYGNPHGVSWNDHPSCAAKKSRKDDLAATDASDAQAPTPKRQCTGNPSPASAPADLSGNENVARTQPDRRAPGRLPTGPRVTRSRPTQSTSETQRESDGGDMAQVQRNRPPGRLPTGPRTTRSMGTQSEPQPDSSIRNTNANPRDRQPVSRPGTLPAGKRAPRSKATTSETQSDSRTRSTKAPPTSTQRGSTLSTTQRKPAAAKSGKRQRATIPSAEAKRSPQQKKASDGHRTHIDESLRPLSDLDAMFHDMLSNGLTKIPQMKEALESLSQRQINIATMCSGTESPLLALGKIQDALRLSGKPALNTKHLFSAEIVPFKQAYIERNFHPDKLFRDIREIAAGGQATTAYGALTDVPSDVDILVAGFSCVDFSNLNKKKKGITDIGESGDTFRAILEYAKKYRPAMIILENVDGAPWNLIQAIWTNDREAAQEHFMKVKKAKGGAKKDKNAPKPELDTFWDDDDPAYSASWHRVDAKWYYIPQTRTRKYMICLDRRRFPSPESADVAVKDWKRYMVALERKASVSVEAFLLPGDDPRLQAVKDELSKAGKPREKRNWEVCQGRHEAYRAEEKLGTARPILEWTNDGSVKASSYLWTDWTLSQVERIWDSIEICYLRKAAKGYDSFYKPRFWELSQNIDRFKDDTPAGIINCITPSGQPFSSFRGGPIIGLEAVALQGLPIDLLLLTRESQRELFDLAGNAMTSTVVGAALLSGLTVSHNILTRPKESVSQPLRDSSSSSKMMRFSELRQKQVLNFDGSSVSTLDELCKLAKESVRLCHCEGQALMSQALIRNCRSCGHKCCEKCGNSPKHNYELLEGNGTPVRTEPSAFRKRLGFALPTRLEFDGLSSETLAPFAQNLPGRSEPDWGLFSQAILLAFKQEYRFESAKRSHCWTIVYNAAHSRLELVFDQDEICWLLFGKADKSEPGNSRLRKLLNLPLARLTVRGRTMRGSNVMAESMFEGSWEIRLPMAHTFSITVTPQKKLTDSWEKKLGLQSEKFIDRQVYTSLHIARTSDAAAGPLLDDEICGDYDLLENCGTACSSLHKKRATADAGNTPPLFFFLDTDRLGAPAHDCFVFSTQTRRMEYDETRYVTAKVDSTWRPPYKDSRPGGDCVVPPPTECTVYSQWESCPIFLRSHEGSDGSCQFPKGDISIPVFGTTQNALGNDIYGCLHGNATTALLSCEVPGQFIDTVGWQVGHWTTMDQKSGRQGAAAFAWLFARVRDLGDFDAGWRTLDPRPSGYRRCLTCAPEPPKIMWTCSRGGKQDKLLPYEDGREAGDFERKIKDRPAPFLVQSSIDDDESHTGRLAVGLNISTLVHRALARLGNIEDSDDIEMKWRLDSQFEVPTRYKLREFTLTDNKLTREADYVFPTDIELRPEQKRSLQWMIGQEADDMAFYEEEIEEASLSQMGWRAEVRVRRSRIVRGGVLADEVGYGKTATTLALVDAQEEKAEEHEHNSDSDCIPLKATLILVPPLLVHQWQGQAQKFLGIRSDDARILVIEDVTHLGKVSVQRIKEAVVVIVSWSVMTSPTYMDRMSYFAALPKGPSSGDREIAAWLARACGNIERHMGELVGKAKSPKAFGTALKRRLKAAYTDEDILRDLPTQRLKGAKYTTWNPTERVIPKDSGPTEGDLEKSFQHMTKRDCTDLDSMTGILLHMFDFNRIVVDEYTYVDVNQKIEKLSSFITSINARSRWVLSGTPKLQDFGDVRNLASFLACNLGVVDDAAGVLKGSAIRHIREDRTAAEQFRAFGYSHTAAWHISRQAHAQEFLDKYASKNVAEIGVIKSVLQLRPHLLGATETVLNAELQQQLQSTEMNIVLYGKSNKDNDRLRRFKDLLKGCKIASECLSKNCELGDTASSEHERDGNAVDADVGADDESLPDEESSNEESSDEESSEEEGLSENELSEDEMDGDLGAEPRTHSDEEVDRSPNSATATFADCEKLINIREEQMKALVVELENDLLHAAWLEQQCALATNPEHRGSHYQQWKSEVQGAGLRDPTATLHLQNYLSTALDEVDADTEEIFYRDPPSPEQLKKEKKAADKRKKQEKDKRTAAGKGRKATRKFKATDVPDEDEQMMISDGEYVQADDHDPDPPDPRPNKIKKDDFVAYAGALRQLTGHLRSLGTELISRTRSLRFARGAQELYEWYSDLSKPPRCEGCGEVALELDNISINVRCGHLTCEECIQKADLMQCAADACGEGCEAYRLRKVVDLVGDGKNWARGSRLGNIIALINNIPEDEQVLLFVQFEDVMLKFAEGLDAANISNYALAKKFSRELITMMNDFQENQGKKKKKVLLLNPSDESASGINLTNANHIIFASPLLTTTQQAYDASMTQCIGRAKRYGQEKTVHIYRFLALKTINVDILQEREQRTLVKMKDLEDGEGPRLSGPGIEASIEEWALVEEDAIDDSMEAGWGSGYNFKSNPTEDE